MKDFLEDVKKVVDVFKEHLDNQIKIVSHIDTDGITAASIASQAFLREGIKFSLSFVKMLDDAVLEELNLEESKIIFFLDLGSGSIKEIERILKDKIVFILDHHKISEKKTKLNLLNLCKNEDADYREISGAGTVYLFFRCMNNKNIDLAYLAVVGAIGDMQENRGFIGLNKLILQDAVNNGDIVVKQGLYMFGIQTKPLDRVLEYSTDPYIPGVTGNREGTLTFLDEIGIKPEGKKYPKVINLNQEEMKKLVTGIILKRLGSEKEPENVLGPIYILKNEKEDMMKDARDFSTLLNSCGRLSRPSLGMGVCLGDKNARTNAIKLLNDYKFELINSLNWFYKKKKNKELIEGEGYMIINSEDNVKDALIGTLASIVAKSNLYKDGTIIIGLAHTLDGETKISARIAGNGDYNLRDLLIGITRKLGNYVAGGHRVACGASIPQEKEQDFIKIAKESLDRKFY